MWPFKKKQIEYKLESRESLCDVLEAKFKPGEWFIYMGRDCLCVSAKERHEIISPWGTYEVYFKPVVTADYVDNNGVIHQLKLDFDEAMRL